MNLTGLYSKIFRSWPAVDDAEKLADFIDQQAAFVAQKGIYEYARARAGHYAKVLFREKEFQIAVERSRWQAYPLGLSMIAELAEGVLTAECGLERRLVLDRLGTLVLSVFDRYPVPASLGWQAWGEAREKLERRLQRIGMHPPKRAKDIPEPFVDRYFDLMPIHEKLRGNDYPTIRNYLRATLCNIHDELTRRLDAKAMAASLGLAAGASGTPAHRSL